MKEDFRHEAEDRSLVQEDGLDGLVYHEQRLQSRSFGSFDDEKLPILQTNQ